MIRINPKAFKQKPYWNAFRTLSVWQPIDILCFLYIILRYFFSKNPNMTSVFFREIIFQINNKKLFNFIVYLPLFNTKETITLINVIYK